MSFWSDFYTEEMINLEWSHCNIYSVSVLAQINLKFFYLVLGPIDTLGNVFG